MKIEVHSVSDQLLSLPIVLAYNGTTSAIKYLRGSVTQCVGSMAWWPDVFRSLLGAVAAQDGHWLAQELGLLLDGIDDVRQSGDATHLLDVAEALQDDLDAGRAVDFTPIMFAAAELERAAWRPRVDSFVASRLSDIMGSLRFETSEQLAEKLVEFHSSTIPEGKTFSNYRQEFERECSKLLETGFPLEELNEHLLGLHQRLRGLATSRVGRGLQTVTRSGANSFDPETYRSWLSELLGERASAGDNGYLTLDQIGHSVATGRLLGGIFSLLGELGIELSDRHLGSVTGRKLGSETDVAGVRRVDFIGPHEVWGQSDIDRISEVMVAALGLPEGSVHIDIHSNSDEQISFRICHEGSGSLRSVTGNTADLVEQVSLSGDESLVVVSGCESKAWGPKFRRGAGDPRVVAYDGRFIEVRYVTKLSEPAGSFPTNFNQAVDLTQYLYYVAREDQTVSMALLAQQQCGRALGGFLEADSADILLTSLAGFVDRGEFDIDALIDHFPPGKMSLQSRYYGARHFFLTYCPVGALQRKPDDAQLLANAALNVILTRLSQPKAKQSVESFIRWAIESYSAAPSQFSENVVGQVLVAHCDTVPAELVDESGVVRETVDRLRGSSIELADLQPRLEELTTSLVSTVTLGGAYLFDEQNPEGQKIVLESMDPAARLFVDTNGAVDPGIQSASEHAVNSDTNQAAAATQTAAPRPRNLRSRDDKVGR